MQSCVHARLASALPVSCLLSSLKYSILRKEVKESRYVTPNTDSTGISPLTYTEREGMRGGERDRQRNRDRGRVRDQDRDSDFLI